MQFHILGLPHKDILSSESHCAYTQKVRRFATEMYRRGHTVYLYGGETTDALCTEHITCLDHEQRAELLMQPLEWDSALPLWQTFADAAVTHIKQRMEPGDFLCMITGAQKPIMDALPQLMAVEFGVGYSGTVAPFRVFESYAWMHAVYGAHAGMNVMSTPGHNFDAVIPNMYDPDEFPQGQALGEYLLYIGRLIPMKGVNTLAAIQKATGLELVVAGGHTLDTGNTHPDCPHRYIGSVGPVERAQVMGDALAVLYPTEYLEPFGGVVIESRMCGTPAITTDWGAFTETVPKSWRCRTLQEFVDAVELAKTVDRKSIRDETIAEFSTSVVGDSYEKYFERLATLRTGLGWYELRSKENDDALSGLVGKENSAIPSHPSVDRVEV